VVQDDGVGIAEPTSRGNGLDNILHRAQHLGGHAEVSSVRPTGTRLDWTVPIVPTPASSPPMA
jgi:signal transduction histidine kinase